MISFSLIHFVKNHSMRYTATKISLERKLQLLLKEKDNLSFPKPYMCSLYDWIRISIAISHRNKFACSGKLLTSLKIIINHLLHDFQPGFKLKEND